MEPEAPFLPSPAAGQRPIRLLLAGGHPLGRELLKYYLEKEPDFQVTGEVAKVEAAAQLALDIPCDVMVLDVAGTGQEAAEAARRLVTQAPLAKIVALAARASRNRVREMLRAGVTGYVLKTGPVRDLVVAIRTIRGGQFFFSPEVACQMQVSHWQTPSNPAEEAELAPREQEVLRMIAQGRNTKEIAVSLRLSVQSIDACRLRLLNKTKVKSIAGLVKYAVREGYVSLDEL
jgi:DNA-binding NarL/FixJ family response regulator